MAATNRIIGEDRAFDPLSGSNCECSLLYNGNNELIQIDKVVGEITYRKTLAWTDGNLTYISPWSKL